MIYILMIWTVVAASDSRGGPMMQYRDWRPIGEFHSSFADTASERCELAAQQLGLKSDAYRCVRSK